GVAAVLAAVPFKQFDLDRHLAPKELALHVVAAIAALSLLVATVRSGRVSLTFIDSCIASFLLLGLASLIFADNWWLASRSVAVSLAGAAVFWAARAIGTVGLARPLIAALALGAVIGAATALLQAYGMVSESVADLASLSRAPGGSF